MFTALGIALGIYTLYAALRGEVYVKHRAWGRTVLREEELGYFWACIGIYAVLAIALCAIF